jgi:hypothetical protein
MEKGTTSSDSGSEERCSNKSKLSLKKKVRGPNEGETSGAFYESTQTTNDEPSKPNVDIDMLEDTDRESVELLPTAQDPGMEMTKLGMSGRLRERITRNSSRRNSPYLDDDFIMEMDKPKRSSRKRKSDVPDREGRKRKRKSDRRQHRRQADSDDEDEDGFERKRNKRKKRKSTLQREETVGRRTTRGKSTVSYRYADEGDEEADLYIVESEPIQKEEEWKVRYLRNSQLLY